MTQKLKLKNIDTGKVYSCGVHERGLPSYCFYKFSRRQAIIRDGFDEHALYFYVKDDYIAKRISFEHKRKAYYFDDKDLAQAISRWGNGFSLVFDEMFVETKPVNRVPLRRRYAETFAGRSQELMKNATLNKNEYNDCTVRAMMECLEIPYDEAHRMMELHRKNRRGCPMARTIKAHFTDRFREVELDRKITLARFTKEHPYGRYIVNVHKHSLCIADGKIYDENFNPGCRVKTAFYRYK